MEGGVHWEEVRLAATNDGAAGHIHGEGHGAGHIHGEGHGCCVGHIGAGHDQVINARGHGEDLDHCAGHGYGGVSGSGDSNSNYGEY